MEFYRANNSLGANNSPRWDDDDDDVCFILDQHVWLDFYSANNSPGWDDDDEVCFILDQHVWLDFYSANNSPGWDNDGWCLLYTRPIHLVGFLLC